MYSYPENIFEAIRQEKQDFLNNYIELVDGLSFNQYETIKKIHKYFNSHYVESDYETINGVKRKKVFWNISKWRCDTATKMLDIDVKDFLLISEDPDTEFNVYLLEKELKAWLKKHKLGKILNEITRKLPVYGSVVLKKVKNGAEIVDLRYLFNDQSAATLDESRYIIQKHLMTAGELRKMSKYWTATKGGVDDVIDKYCNFTAQSYENSGSFNAAVGSPYAEVYERYGEVPLSWFTDREADKDEFVLAKFIVSGIGDFSTDDTGKFVTENGTVLYKEQLKELPFKEVHYNKTEGRWLGIGVVEDTFEDQRRINQVKDQEAKAMELSSLILFQTADQIIQKNMISDVDNGDFIKTGQGGVNRLDTSSHALGEFQSVAESYENHANKMTFSSDLLSGEAAPASTTATAVMNQVQQAQSVYDYKKENIGLFLQEFIQDLVFPEIKGEINQKHLFRLAGDIQEIDKIREKVFNYYVNDILAENLTISESELTVMKSRFMKGMSEQGAKIWMDVEKNFFDNIEYEVSLEITGEGKNTQAQLQNLQFVFGLFGQNPMLFQNPILKRLLYKVMSLMGMSASELENTETEMAEHPQSPQMPLNGSQQGANPQTQQIQPTNQINPQTQNA